MSLRRDWPSVEFDQARNLWVCTSHRDPECRQCAGAFEVLGPRNAGRQQAAGDLTTWDTDEGRRRADKAFADLGGERGPSAQEVWRAGKYEIDAAMMMLLDDEQAVREGRDFVSEARLKELLARLLAAEACFEKLEQFGSNLHIVRPLIEGCRRLAGGLMSGVGDEVFAGRKLIVDTMLPIEEERELRRRKGG